MPGSPSPSTRSRTRFSGRSVSRASCSGFWSAAALAVSGAALQGVFRNPLADPTIVGVASGASVGAVAAILLGLSGAFYGRHPDSGVRAAGSSPCSIVYALARSEGRTETVTLVLVGCRRHGASRAPQCGLTDRERGRRRSCVTSCSGRSGSLGGATWPLVVATVPFVRDRRWPRRSRRRVRSTCSRSASARQVISASTSSACACCSSSRSPSRRARPVAAAGIVAFVGLIVPHVVRLLGGPSNRVVLPVSLLAGGAIVALADLLARTIVAPVELPLGVVTALAGGPLFLWLILRTRQTHGGWA